MITDLIPLDLDRATIYAEDLPDHDAQVERYAAAGLTRPEAFSLEARAAKIISIGQRGILEIGRELVAAREEAKYGTWGPFLERSRMQERTAQNYMHVAERFGEQPEIISALPVTALYALAAPAADQAVVAEIVAEVTSGAPAPTVQEVKQRLNPPPPLPELPTDLVAAGWRIRAVPAQAGQYDAVNDTGGHATPPGSLSEVIAKARALDQQLARSAPAAALARPGGGSGGGGGGAQAHSVQRRDDDAEEEIARAVPPPPLPTLTPLTPVAPTLTPLAAVAVGFDVQMRKLLVAKRALLASTLELIDVELARTTGPTIVIREAAAQEAARLFLNNQGLGGAAAMLAFSAVVEEQAA